MTTEEMSAIRSQGVGGSDMGDILSLPPYGCSRRLWYEKRQEPPDYDRKNAAVLQRGHALEPLIVAEFEKEFHIKATAMPTIYHPAYRFLFVHVDRYAFDEERGAVHLECKTAGREVFRKFQTEGLPDYYLAQVQYGMALTTAAIRANLDQSLLRGIPAGAIFGVLWPDGWQFEWVKVRRDEEYGDSLVSKAVDWWSRFMAGNEEPARLPANDNRCGECGYRTTCQGKRLLELADDAGDAIEFVDMGEDFDSLLTRHNEARLIRDAANEEVDRLRDRIKERLGDRQVVDVPGFRVWFKAHERKAYSVPASVVRSLRIFPR